MATAMAAITSPRPTSVRPPLPLPITGWVTIESGCCQCTRPETASASTTSDSRRRHHAAGRDKVLRDARDEHREVDTDPDRDAGWEEDGLAHVVEHRQEADRLAQYPGDDAEEGAGPREHGDQLAKAERAQDGEEAADQVGRQGAGPGGGDDDGADDKKRRGRRDIRQDKGDVAERIDRALELGLVAQAL